MRLIKTINHEIKNKERKKEREGEQGSTATSGAVAVEPPPLRVFGGDGFFRKRVLREKKKEKWLLQC